MDLPLASETQFEIQSEKLKSLIRGKNSCLQNTGTLHRAAEIQWPTVLFSRLGIAECFTILDIGGEEHKNLKFNLE